MTQITTLGQLQKLIDDQIVELGRSAPILVTDKQTAPKESDWILWGIAKSSNREFVLVIDTRI